MLLAVAAGIAGALVFVAVTVQPGVYFSGDGGLKALAARMHAEGRGSAFAFPAPPWARTGWERGLFPFGPPFAYAVEGRPVLAFPPLYPVLAAPFYASIGEAGLTLLSVAGFAGCLLALAWVARQQGYTAFGTATAILAAALASPLLPYAAIVWEHTLATALAVLALALLFSETPWHQSCSGVAALLAAALRPELGLFQALSGLSLLTMRPALLSRPRLVRFALGALAAACAVGALNLGLTGRLLGLHGKQVDLRSLAAGASARRLALTANLLETFPLVLCGFLLWARRDDGALALPRRLFAAAVAFTVLAPWMLPNDGGLQFGPRYLLAWVPVTALALAALVSRARDAGAGRPFRVLLVLAAAAGMAWGLRFNVTAGRTLAHNYSGATLPALEFLRSRPEPLVVVTHQWSAQELTSLIPSRVFFRIQGLDGMLYIDEDPEPPPLGEQVAALLAALQQAGLDEFLLVARKDQRIPRQVRASNGAIRLQPMATLGLFDLYRGTR